MSDQASPLNTNGSGYACPSCNGGGVSDVVSLKHQPVLCNQLWRSEADARAAPTASIDLAFCPDCTLLANRSFQPDKIAYTACYENALHFSPRFRAFAEELGEGLISRHGLKGGRIIEIGCGDGYFLDLMVRLGAATATGFDPAMADRTTSFVQSPNVRIVADAFREGQLQTDFNALICRHVLEHIPEPLVFMKDIRDAIRDRSCVVYFEVPNGEWILRTSSIWDVIYEHVTYWTVPAIETLFWRAGFRPLNIRSAYGDQFLSIEAVPDTPDPDYLPAAAVRQQMWDLQEGMRERAAEKLDYWNRRIGDLSHESRQAALWGAGSKGVTFANAMAQVGDCLVALVDLNTRKHGGFVPGAALPVIAPEELCDLLVSDVLVSNDIYLDEIQHRLEDLGLDCAVAAI